MDGTTFLFYIATYIFLQRKDKSDDNISGHSSHLSLRTSWELESVAIFL